MKLRIEIDNLQDGEVVKLLKEHHVEMHNYSPPESIHALDESSFFESCITFWSARDGSNVAACGALKELDGNQGEIKSMRTVQAYRKNGIAERILSKIMEEAKLRGYQRLYLETGTHDAFKPAVKLYKKYGFSECGPFVGYELDPNSLFMVADLGASRNICIK